jgi:hypothetical protein
MLAYRGGQEMFETRRSIGQLLYVLLAKQFGAGSSIIFAFLCCMGSVLSESISY